MKFFVTVLFVFLGYGQSQGLDDELIGLPIEFDDSINDEFLWKSKEGDLWSANERQRKQENWDETLARLCRNNDLIFNDEIVDCESLEIIPKSLKIDRHEMRKREAQSSDLEEGSGIEPDEDGPAKLAPAEQPAKEEPADFVLVKAMPAEVVPAETAKKEAVPEADPAGADAAEPASAKAVPAEVVPKEAVPAETVAAEVLANEADPAEAVPAETIPEVPAEAVPAVTVPEIPAEAVPAETVPEVPAEAVPAETVPEVPAEAVPAGTVPEVPAEAVPGVTVPEVSVEAVPAETVPEIPADAVPAETVPEVPAEAVPAETVPEVPAEAVPAGTVPEVPAEAVPGVTVPEVSVEAVPAETVPEIPADAVPAETVPEVPAEAVPAETVPAETVPEVPAETVPAETIPEVPTEAKPAESVPPEEDMAVASVDVASTISVHPITPEHVQHSETSSVDTAKESGTDENHESVEGKNRIMTKEYLNEKQSGNVVVDGFGRTMEETDAALNKERANASIKNAEEEPKSGESSEGTAQANAGSNKLLIALFVAVCTVGVAAFTYNYVKKKNRSRTVNGDAKIDVEEGKEMKPLMTSAERRIPIEYKDEKEGIVES